MDITLEGNLICMIINTVKNGNESSQTSAIHLSELIIVIFST